MKTKAITVRSHNRALRKDRVGEMLRAASSLHKPRTLNDWVTEYSEKNDDDSLDMKDRILWHLDPVERRAVITQAQIRLRQARDAVTIVDEHGDIHEIEKAVTAGEFASLLGTKLTPSMNTSKAGREPIWCAGITPMVDTRAAVDGLLNPAIVELTKYAIAANDISFTTGSAIRNIAKMPKACRAIAIDEKKRDYKALILKNEENTELHTQVKRRDNEILRLTHINVEMQQRVEALESSVKVINTHLSRDYAN